jgi:hypothetical protein
MWLVFTVCDWYVPFLCTLVYSHVLSCTLVYSCVLLCTLVWVHRSTQSTQEYTRVHESTQEYTRVHKCCTLLYTYVYVVVLGSNQPFEDSYGLTKLSVPGDGHCLFHTLASLDRRRSYMEWRSYLCNEVVQLVVLCTVCVLYGIQLCACYLGVDMLKFNHIWFILYTGAEECLLRCSKKMVSG